MHHTCMYARTHRTQVPQENLIPNKTYAFFSHTIKAQSENMPLLNEILKKNIKLVDYECITADGQRGSPRLVAFGQHAGRAGMINALRSLGQRLLYCGSSSPFLNVSSAYMYPDFPAACDAVTQAGKQLASHPFVDPTIGPLTFVFTGSGNVTQGALEVFKVSIQTELYL
jgi:alpha-aminoadipic semialdehyde synthase